MGIACSTHNDLALRMLGFMSQHFRVIVELLDDLTLKDMEAGGQLGAKTMPAPTRRGRN